MTSQTSKILLVIGDALPPRFAEYALTMAQRLDLEIVALFVDTETKWRSSAEKQKAVRRFEASVEGEAARFAAQAWEKAVNVITIVDVDSMESAIEAVREQEQEIRFILSCNQIGGEEIDSDSHHPKLTVLKPA